MNIKKAIGWLMALIPVWTTLGFTVAASGWGVLVVAAALCSFVGLFLWGLKIINED